MKITFLGTAHGFAEKNQFNSGTLIEAGNGSYILDAGAPLEYALVQKDKRPEDIDAIFVSHMHNDHVGSLSFLACTFFGYRPNSKAKIFLPEENGISAFKTWLLAMHESEKRINDTLHFERIDPGILYSDENIRVEARPNHHLAWGGFPAYSFVFEEKGKKVLFTCDMGAKLFDYPDIIGDEEYDLVVSEMAHGDLCETKEMLKKTKTKRMLLTHCNPKRIAGHEEIFTEFPFEISLAYDGLTVEI